MFPLDPAHYALFCAVMAAFAIAPGPANLFMIATGVRQGRRAVVLGVAGLNAASLIWIAAAALGLGALALSFPWAFRAAAVAGGLYIGWLGLKSLWAAALGKNTHFDLEKSSSPRDALRDGFVVQLSNPKAIVFFSAILPAFVDPARPALPQMLLLGLTTVFMDVVTMMGYGFAGSALASVLEERGPRRLFSLLVGVLLTAAALFLLLRH
jgi:threonine/homoserine/homoserine lactone efflux protein